MMKEYLQEHGMSSDVAFNGRSAIEMLQVKKYQVLLTDYKLPDLDGEQVMAKCKKIQPDLKVIIITAHREIISRLRSKIGRTFQVIEKPCRAKTILAAIQKML